MLLNSSKKTAMRVTGLSRNSLSASRWGQKDKSIRKTMFIFAHINPPLNSSVVFF